MKNCIICKELKPLDEFYAHKGMKDGHLNKCKKCTKSQSKERHYKLCNDKDWVQKEQKRHRDKYYRLNYREKHKPSSELQSVYRKKHIKKYPEKYKAKILSNRLKAKTKGNHLHHWSYNVEHAKCVIELNIKDHHKIHRFLKYDKKTFMYKDLNGVLLNTREKHLKYINKVLKHFN